MPTIRELPVGDLRAAGDAVETLIDLRDYLPADGELVTRAGRLRDLIRETLGVRKLEAADRGPEVRLLSELPQDALAELAQAVVILLGRFAPFIEDQGLLASLGELNEDLTFLLIKDAGAAEEARAS